MPRRIKACASCHSKKIKCDGGSPCERCSLSKIPCLPHKRRQRDSAPRKSEHGRNENPSPSLQPPYIRNAPQQDLPIWHLDNATVRADTIAALPLSRGGRASEPGSGNRPYEYSTTTNSPLLVGERDAPGQDHHADISLLALNATGEMRYMGPSSGCLFAKYAIHFAKNLIQQDIEPEESGRQTPAQGNVHVREPKLAGLLNLRVRNLLLQTYLRWIQPIYALFDEMQLHNLIEQFPYEREGTSRHSHQHHASHAIAYLVMALGAVPAEQPHIADATAHDPNYSAYKTAASQGVKPETLFNAAIETLDACQGLLNSKLFMVQTLILISIYSSYKASGDSVWQISGLAMRTAIEIGLHRDQSTARTTQDSQEFRRRIFWTAYVIEITTAFNLGRPPSINLEDIRTPLPSMSSTTATALHHITYRKIQHRVVRYVYGSTTSVDGSNGGDGSGSHIEHINSLGQELENWRAQLSDMVAASGNSYPFEFWDRLYHSTVAALHRPSPYCPSPDTRSWVICFESSVEVISIHHKLLRFYKVPHSWILVQGLILSTVTALITVRLNATTFITHFGLSRLIELLNECVRKTSIVLAVVSERWSGESSLRFERLLAALAKDTLAKVTASQNKAADGSLNSDNTTINQSGKFATQQDLLPTPVAGMVDLPFDPQDNLSAGMPDPTDEDAFNALFEDIFATDFYGASSYGDGGGGGFSNGILATALPNFWDTAN